MTPLQPEQPRAAWLQLVAELGGRPDMGSSLYVDLARRYSEAGRHYHTLDHLAAMLGTLAVLPLPAASSPAVRLAVWFHDAIYDSRASDNEERSCAHLRGALQPLGWPETLLDETARLILLTRLHQTTPDDTEGQVLLDADLAILGAQEKEYDRYAQAIREEYAWVEEERYRAERGQVLQRFLQRPRLYFTQTLFDRAEQQARHNLRRELHRLG